MNIWNAIIMRNLKMDGKINSDALNVIKLSPPTTKKNFKEHLLVHDLSIVMGALRRYDMIRKRVQPLHVHAPATVDPTSITTSKNEAPAWNLEENPASAPVEQSPPTKNKAGRPRSKSVFNSSSGKISESISKPSAPATLPTTEPTRKRRRVSNETTTQATTSIPSNTSTASSSGHVPSLSAASASLEAASTNPDQKASSTASLPPPLSTSTPTSIPQSQSVSNLQKVLPTLNSACPNCNQNLGKPWHLVDHMIQMHEAQLLRLHRTLKKPDGPSVGMSQTFSDRHCPFCQLTYADMQTSLLHVVRTHRSRLFECPDNGECVLTCELMCAIGPDAAPKKFTISVKVKRKTNE